jgi:hypothetical protein
MTRRKNHSFSETNASVLSLKFVDKLPERQSLNYGA